MMAWARGLAAALVVGGLAVGPAVADVAAEMRTLFNGLGAQATADRPRYIAAQTRNVFAGGGLSYRVPRDSFSLLGVTPPSLDAGCGGIDMYAGSFSFINSDEFVRMLKTIAANASGLAFKTALCATSANLCQAIEDLQKTLQGLNRFNIDSCEAAKQLVGGFMGNMEQSAQTSCQAVGRGSGLFADDNAARAHCGTTRGQADARAAAATAGTADEQPVEFTGGNLTWTILGEFAASLPRQDREFIMSMLGTHVVTTTTLALRQFPPTVTSIADLNARVVTLLSCGDPADCLVVTPRAVTLSTSFLDLAAERLADMRGRLQRGEEFTDVQLDLAAGSPVPVIALLQADLAGAAGLTPIAAEAVAYASAHHYLTNVLRRAAAGVGAWRSRSANEAELARAMVEDTRRLRTALTTEMGIALSRVSQVLEVNERVNDLRARLAGEAFRGLPQ